MRPNSIPPGRRRSARERLVREIFYILQEAKELIDAKPQGTLCVLLSIILEDADEKPSDVRKLVKPVVLELSKKSVAVFSKPDC